MPKPSPSEQDYAHCVVLTGAPCSGKTSAMRSLHGLGFGVCDEAAELHVLSELNSGKKKEDILADCLMLEREITRLALLREAGIPSTGLHFLDRSAIDSVAYSRFYGVHPVPFHDEIRARRYNPKVFLFERLGLLDDRLEHGDADAALLEQYLHEAYGEAEYNVVRVPLMSVRSRARFILSELQESQSGLIGLGLQARMDALTTSPFIYQNVQPQAPVQIDEDDDRQLQDKAFEEGMKGLLVCCILVNERNEVLLLKRSLHDEHAPGSKELAGGKKEAGETLLQALSREVEEETGMKCETSYFVGSFDTKSPEAVWRSFAFLARVQGSDVHLNPEEHSGYSWEDFTNKRLFEYAGIESPGQMILTHAVQRALFQKAN